MANIVTQSPRHRQVFEQLRQGIRTGEYRPGDRLPTETELMEQFSTSRTTVIRAMRDLANEGLLMRRRGSGSFVLDINGAKQRTLGLFMPFVETGAGLPYIGGLIHQHLADLAGQNHAMLALQCLVRGKASLQQRMMQSAQALLDCNVSGVFYYPAELPPAQMHYNRQVLDKLTEAGVAVVLVDRDIVAEPGRSEFTLIGYDNRRGSCLLTDHLIQTGCRRIAFIGIPEVSTAVADRLTGYYDALRAHGIAVDDSLVRMIDKVDLTETFCRKLVDEAKPDAIIGKMDRFAAVIGRHLLTMGINIGVDIKLAGFDDDPIAEFLPVALTTIRLPIGPFARVAHDALVRRIEYPDIDPRQIIIDTELVIRKSTAASLANRGRRKTTRKKTS